MERKIKIIIIFHLCIIFTYLSWFLAQPPLKTRYLKKAASMLYQEMLGREMLFNALSKDKQERLKNDYALFITSPSSSYFQSAGDILLKETSPFTLAWLFFSFLICILLLFQIEGASMAAWILPALSIAYGVVIYLSPALRTESIFPSEKYVLERYLSQSSSGHILNRKKELQEAWHRYLIVEWAFEVPSEDLLSFQKQLDKGLFAFNQKRLERLFAGIGENDLLLGFKGSPSFFILLAYCGWNLFFAWRVRKCS